jgi:hypothetical protein
MFIFSAAEFHVLLFLLLRELKIVKVQAALTLEKRVVEKYIT